MTSPTRPVRIAVAGAGAFGTKHLDALAVIDGAEVTVIVSKRIEQAKDVAANYGAPAASADLSEILERDDIDAAILCTPTPLHAEQAIAVLRAGKYVEVEIPLADSWDGAASVAEVQRETGLVCMRRSNLNADNQPRSWTDHLLWHHAAHTVDLLRYQTGDDIVTVNAVQGPRHPELGIAMACRPTGSKGRTASSSLRSTTAGTRSRTSARCFRPTGCWASRQRGLASSGDRDRRRGCIDEPDSCIVGGSLSVPPTIPSVVVGRQQVPERRPLIR